VQTDDSGRAVPDGVDASRPSTGRVYDYLLNGTQWYPADQQAADQLIEKVPQVWWLVQANRRFLQKVTAVMARDYGLRQFIDVGSGIPTQFNTHEVVHVIDPNIPVVYVDNEPQVLAHGAELLRRAGEKDVVMVEGDIREPASILDNPQVRELIDFDRPVGYVHCAIWHLVSDEDDPQRLLREYVDAVPSGSQVAISHATADGQRPDQVQRIIDVYARADAPAHFRTFEAVDQLVRGAGLVFVPPYEGAEPGLSYVEKWGSKNPDEVDPAHTWVPAGLALKP
jgi:S-adenosyl methyltransferase